MESITIRLSISSNTNKNLKKMLKEKHLLVLRKPKIMIKTLEYLKKYPNEMTNQENVESFYKGAAVQKLNISPVNPKKNNIPLVFIPGNSYLAYPREEQIKYLTKICQHLKCFGYIINYPLCPQSNVVITVKTLRQVFEKLMVSSVNIITEEGGMMITLALYQELMKQNKVKINKIVALSPWVTTDIKMLKDDRHDPFIKIKALEPLWKIWNAGEKSDSYLVNGINTKLDDQLDMLIINGEKDAFSHAIKHFCEFFIDKNIKWLEYSYLHRYFYLTLEKEASDAFMRIVNFIDEKES